MENKKENKNYDPLLALWTAVILPPTEETKNILQGHNDKLRILSDIGQQLFDRMEHNINNNPMVEIIHQVIFDFSVNSVRVTISSVGM